MATVVLIGTLDTKAREYAYVRDRLRETGCEVVLIDVGILADPGCPVDFSREEVAAAAGSDLETLVEADRGTAVEAMAQGAVALVQRLFEEGRLDGVLGLGGSGGSSIISRAMRSLPVGVPKLLVSTMGAGNVAPYVGTSDLAVMYSVVDIAGLNRVTRQIFSNAAHAIAGMARGATGASSEEGAGAVVGATMYGTTTPCVSRAVAGLERSGHEVLVFHATGTGGRAMEMLMRGGEIGAVLDVTTAELMAEIVGGTFTAGPDRLRAAGDLGLPQVVSLGGVDQVAFTPPETVPRRFRERTTYAHNPSITLVRSNAGEAEQFAHDLAERLNRAKGPVALFLPLLGTSAYAVEGGVFHAPEVDAVLFDALRTGLGPEVEIVEMDTDINDPVFADAMASRLEEMIAVSSGRFR